MRRYVLDTNVCLHIVRGSALGKTIETHHRLTLPDAAVVISVVTKAELLSLGLRNNWGKQKLDALEVLLRKLIIVSISDKDEDLMNAYAKIDAYTQSKLTAKPLGTSARKMGKNDLWIAATTRVAKAELITTDADFDLLHTTYFTVHKHKP